MKQAQLVCQHLENISRDALEQHQDIIRQYVRGRWGVYALYRRNKLYYVGLATNLRNRLKHHLRDRHGSSWDRFSVYLTIGGHHLRELEALILRTAKPSGNKQQGKFARSEDLRRRFRADIKRVLMDQVDGLFGDLRPSRPHRRTPRLSGADHTPVLAEYITGPLALRGKHKGQRLTAKVRRDGMVRFGGKLFHSPSMAGAAAVKRPSCNGWTFWEYERAPGDWVKLDQLRK